jgi:hypothetical protein
MEISSEEEKKIIGYEKDGPQVAQEYEMNTWYYDIEDLTFPTTFIQLTPEIIGASINASSYNTRRKTEPTSTSNVLESLEAEIDKQLQEFGGAAFVKLNTRSPKDVVFESKNDKVEELLRAEITKLQATNQTITANDELIAFIKAGTHAMKYTSGREVIKMMTDSSRVYQDLKGAQDRSKSIDTPMYVVIRKWIDFPLSAEFRGFVCQQKFNALSQYFHFCYWPELVQHKDEIARRVTEYWETRVKHRVKHTSYTIDFAVLQDQIYVIEINPFHFSTGAALFRWTTGSAERKTLVHGPFEMRVLEQPDPSAKEHYMVPYYEKLLDKLLREEDSESEKEKSRRCIIS